MGESTDPYGLISHFTKQQKQDMMTEEQMNTVIIDITSVLEFHAKEIKELKQEIKKLKREK